MIYTGPDQRKEERAIVLGMACPQCSGPVHDPSTTAKKQRERGWTPSTHGAYACMDEKKCRWNSNNIRYDDVMQQRRMREAKQNEQE